jgi:hypothetical protein
MNIASRFDFVEKQNRARAEHAKNHDSKRHCQIHMPSLESGRLDYSLESPGWKMFHRRYIVQALSWQ